MQLACYNPSLAAGPFEQRMICAGRFGFLLGPLNLSCCTAAAVPCTWQLTICSHDLLTWLELQQKYCNTIFVFSNRLRPGCSWRFGFSHRSGKHECRPSASKAAKAWAPPSFRPQEMERFVMTIAVPAMEAWIRAIPEICEISRQQERWWKWPKILNKNEITCDRSLSLSLQLAHHVRDGAVAGGMFLDKIRPLKRQGHVRPVHLCHRLFRQGWATKMSSTSAALASEFEIGSITDVEARLNVFRLRHVVQVHILQMKKDIRF